MEKEELSEDRRKLLEQIAELDSVHSVRPIEETSCLSTDGDHVAGHKGLKLEVYLVGI